MMPLAFVHDKDIPMKDAVSAFLWELLSILIANWEVYSQATLGRTALNDQLLYNKDPGDI